MLPAAPQTVTLTATGSEKAPAFSVEPATLKEGAATLTVKNSLDKGSVDGQMVFVADDRTDKEIASELAKAVEGKPVADWFQAAGGPSEAEQGASASATQELKAGTYVVLSGNEAPKLPLARIEVAGDGGPALEPPPAKITATEYAFAGTGVKSGQPVLLENAGGTWHHFLASRLKPGATLAQAKKYLATEKGEPPFAEENGLETTVMDGGVAQIATFTGKPGRYAFFCFVSDKKTGGPPHVVKGMVSEVVVE